MSHAAFDARWVCHDAFISRRRESTMRHIGGLPPLLSRYAPRRCRYIYNIGASIYMVSWYRPWRFLRLDIISAPELPRRDFKRYWYDTNYLRAPSYIFLNATTFADGVRFRCLFSSFFALMLMAWWPDDADANNMPWRRRFRAWRLHMLFLDLGLNITQIAYLPTLLYIKC